MTSITKNKYIYIVFWLILWQILSVIISKTLILPSPINVTLRVISFFYQKNFYISAFNTFIKVLYGFILSAIFGTVLAVISRKIYVIYNIFAPIINIIKVIPVASFIILALFWINSKYISVLISLLMVLPVFYTNIYNSMQNANEKLLQMSKVYNFSKIKEIIYIYVPSMKNELIASITLGISLAIKSSIAGEVIAFSNKTIGFNLQNSKSLLETTDIFAWTIIIIVVSFILEKFLVYIFNKILDCITKIGVNYD